MFDKLIELVVNIWHDIKPAVIIPYQKRGIRQRGGIPGEDYTFYLFGIKHVLFWCNWLRTKTVIAQGFHWKIPVFDSIETIVIKPKTIDMLPQSMTTKDNVSVMAAAIIKYEVEDVKKAILEANTPTEAISDMVQGIIRDKIADRNWSECNTSKLVSDISRTARAEAKEWGLTIIKVTLTDMVRSSYVRFLDNSISSESELSKISA